MMKNFLSYLKGWKGIALISYMWLILMAYALAYIDVGSAYMAKRFYILSIAEVILLALMYICPKLLEYAEHLVLKPDAEGFTRNQKRKFFLKSWLVSFGVMFVIYIIFYPGGFSPDSLDQYLQAIGAKNYQDWHPVLHTLFMFTLPLKLSGGWIGSILLFQIVIISLALAYAVLTLAEYGGRKYAAIFMAYILISPMTLRIIIYPWKDVSFAVFTMLSMIWAVKTYFSGGEWLKHKRNVAVFVIVLSCATIFRHNAILFTLPLLLVMLYYAGRTQKIMLIAGCCAVIFLVRGGLYPYLGAEKPGYRVSETTRVPMTIIADSVYEVPEKLDSDIVDFFNSIAPDEDWRENYVLGAFNSVKFTVKIYRAVIEQAGYAKIFSMTLRCLKQAPYVALRGFARVTDMVYGITGPADWGGFHDVVSNDVGIRNEGIRPLQSLLKLWSDGSRVFFKHIFWQTGILLLCVIVTVLARADFTRFCFAVPLLAYDFGTMLFLGGDDFRFFWCTYLVFPLLMLILLRNNSEAKS